MSTLLETGLADAPARDTARLDLANSVIVEAGAGTGKTTLLIDRIAFLLLGRRADGSALDINRLVALTFTEKAASEIKFRLAERLNQISLLAQGGGDPMNPALSAARRCLEDLRGRFQRSPEEVLGLAQAALRDIERSQIGTIHSFCSHVLRLYPLEAGLDPEFRVDAGEEELEELFASEWALWLDRELGENAPQPELWREALASAELSGLEALARELVGPRVDLEAAAKPAWAAPRLREAAARAAKLSEGKPKPRGRILDYLPWMSERFAAAARAVEGGPASWAPSPTSSPPSWPANWDSEGKADYERLARLAARLDPRVEEAYRKAIGLLRPFVESFRAAYRRRGAVSFDGLLVGARDLLRGDYRVRNELKARFEALLIDEFQDTDPLQGELLMFLAEARGACAARWEDVVLEKGKLFLVGDPKQSIYRFRGADIAAMESFSAHALRQGALRRALQVNFRSSAAIVSSVNEVFSAVMRPMTGLQPGYIPIHPGPAKDAGPAPEWLRVEPAAGEAVGAEESRRAEAAWIARWVQHERGGHRLRDIAVVLRSTSSLGIYLQALKSAGVPYVVEAEKYFYATQEVADFLNLLRAVDDPEDRIALLGVLRGPLAVLEDREIYELSKEGLLDYRVKASGAVEALYATLRRFHEAAGREPLGALVGALLRETYLIEIAATAYHHQQTASNLLKFGRLAAEASDRGETLKEFIEAVAASMKTLREEGESPLADEDYDAVRILTIHKAKGLEYPVVLLPNLAGRMPGAAGDAAVRIGWSDAGIGLRLKGCPAANAAMALLEEDEDARQREEEVRILYVAMTRAKERLILLGGSTRKGASFASLLDQAACLPARALESRAAGKPTAGIAALSAVPAGTPKSWAALWKARLKRREDAVGSPVFVHPSGVEKPSEADPEAFLRSVGGGKALGVLCHEVLQRWDFRAEPAPEALRSAVELRAAWLAREHPDEDWEALRWEAEAVLLSFLRSDSARELAAAEILGRELPFVYSEGGAVVRGTIDLLYRRDSRLVVADYKTDAVTGAERARRAKKYETQGAYYARAVEKALGVSGVEFRVLFLRQER